MAIGYILAVVFLILLLIMVLRRVKTYEEWQKSHLEREMTSMGSPEMVLRNNG